MNNITQEELDDDQEAQRLMKLSPLSFVNENLNPPFSFKLTDSQRAAFAYCFDCASGKEKFNRRKYDDVLHGKYKGDLNEQNNPDK